MGGSDATEVSDGGGAGVKDQKTQVVSRLHASNSAHLSLVYPAGGTNTRRHTRMNRFLLRSKVNAASKVKLTLPSHLEGGGG